MESQVNLEDLELLLETNRLLSAKLDLSELLNTIMNLATRFMKAEASSVLLLDERTQELYFDVAVGGSADKIKGTRIPLGEGIAGWVAKEGKPCIVPDVAKDPRWRGDVKAAEDGLVTRSLIAVPLKLRGKTVGVIEAINRCDGGEFVEVDLKLFDSFASQAAVAIDNARLFSSLRVEKEKIEKIFDNMADAVILTDETGRIVTMNVKAEQWFADAKPVSIADIHAGGYEFKPSPEAIFAASEDSGTVDIKRSGAKTFILSAQWNRISETQGKGLHYAFVLRDMTQSRREEILQKNFLSMISHKLRTPLVAITGYIPFLLEESSRLSDMQKRAVDAIDKEGRHLAYLVDDLIRFTMVSALGQEVKLKAKKTNLAKAADDAIAKTSALAIGVKANVRKDIDATLEITAYPALLSDMLRSLIENAIKFNDKKDKDVAVAASVVPAGVLIKVSDNGPGIPPEERDKMFEWFHQIEEHFTGQVKGMGLGMAFVKKVAQLHGGSITFNSRLGEGTSFEIIFPS